MTKSTLPLFLLRLAAAIRAEQKITASTLAETSLSKHDTAHVRRIAKAGNIDLTRLPQLRDLAVMHHLGVEKRVEEAGGTAPTVANCRTCQAWIVWQADLHACRSVIGWIDAQATKAD